MEVLTSDWEVTTWSKGSAFDQRNKAVCVAGKQNDNETHCEFDLTVYDGGFLLDFDLCVFFNAKFDLHWYRRLGYVLPTKIWCCQVAEFVLSGQKIRYPSLEETAVKYNLGHKIDIVKEEFWERKCTCHVSIAKQWKNYMQNNFAEHATTINMAKQGLVGLKKKENGEKLIQSCMRVS